MDSQPTSLQISKTLKGDKFGISVLGVEDCIRKGLDLLYKDKTDVIVTLTDGTHITDDEYLRKLDEKTHILLVPPKTDTVDSAMGAMNVSDKASDVESVLKRLKSRHYSFDALTIDNLQVICDADIEEIVAGLNVDEEEAQDLQIVAHESLRVKIDTPETAEFKRWIDNFDNVDSKTRSQYKTQEKSYSDHSSKQHSKGTYGSLKSSFMPPREQSPRTSKPLKSDFKGDMSLSHDSGFKSKGLHPGQFLHQRQVLHPEHTDENPN